MHCKDINLTGFRALSSATDVLLSLRPPQLSSTYEVIKIQYPPTCAFAWHSEAEFIFPRDSLSRLREGEEEQRHLRGHTDRVQEEEGRVTEPDEGRRGITAHEVEGVARGGRRAAHTGKDMVQQCEACIRGRRGGSIATESSFNSLAFFPFILLLTGPARRMTKQPAGLGAKPLSAGSGKSPRSRTGRMSARSSARTRRRRCLRPSQGPRAPAPTKPQLVPVEVGHK